MDTITNNFDFRKQNKNSEKEEFWNQYFAGFIDGDETLLISKLGYASLEITMDISDEHALQKMKHVLGGSVKTLTNAKAFRYRLHHKKGMLDLISRMNGKIQQTNRKVQLEKICNLYDIVCLPTSMLTQQNVWFAGFFDADGSLGFSLKKGWPQLVMSAAQKNHVDLLPFQEVFGGIIRLDKRSNAFKWEIYTEKSILDFYHYCQKHPLHSHKKKRMFLVPRFFELRKMRAYRFDASLSLKKTW